MKSTIDELLPEWLLPLSFGKMSPESSAQKTTPLVAFLQDLPVKMIHSSHQGANGQTQVMCLAPKEQSRGEFSTPNISEWPNDAVVCSLSQVLEQTSIPQRFFLSSTACAGILRRADKRGKQLPPQLEQALRSVAQETTELKPMPSSQCASTRGGMGRLDAESETLLPIALQDVTPREKAQNGKGWNDDGTAYTVDTHATQGVAQAIPIDTMNMTPGHSSGGLGFGQPGDPSFTLTKGHSHAVAQPIAFHPTQDPISSTDGTTHAMGCGSSGGQASVAVAIGWDEELNASIEQSGTLLRGGQGGRHDGVMQPNMAVRRLTPVECERLQGFPDNYTNIKDKCPDGPRYKALGNSWAVPVVRWIGERIQKVIENANP